VFFAKRTQIVQCLQGNLKNSKPIKAIPKPKKTNLNPIKANFWPSKANQLVTFHAFNRRSSSIIEKSGEGDIISHPSGR